MTNPISRDPEVRLKVFVQAGLLDRVPTTWQLLQGQIEMAPYVMLPDAGDHERYAGARLGHPLLRTPIVLREIGPDHLRIGHGLHNSAESLYRHLNFVLHQGMPVYDLQLVQTVPDGLEELRRYTTEIEWGTTPERTRQRRRIDLVLPDASEYRRKFIERDGWIDRAARFEYDEDDTVAGFLRLEFTSLIRFVNYCARTFPAQRNEHRLRDVPWHLGGLFARRFLETGR